VAGWLVEKHTDRINLFGGRGITNAIEDEIMLPLARAVLRAEYNGQQHVIFQVRSTTDGVVRVEMA
jgi:ATP-dependent Clp protease ATP-binding subunit ClpA